MKAFFRFANLLVISSQVAQAALPNWTYDPGPDPKTKMGKELIDLVANIPNMPEISLKIMADQKFRPAFGPVNWRMLQGENKVKILFIGQDATHIAEAAGRTATAGFGGRGQDLAAYFGVNEGAGFMNTYSYTIQGQYGAFQTPYVYTSENGATIRHGSLVANDLWLMSQDQGSPMVKWRNGLIDWIMRNNKDSLKLIVTFGGAARDAVGSYIEAKGGKVGARHEERMKNIQIAETKLEYAGGNNEYPVLLDRSGKDLYTKILGRKLDYSKESDKSLVMSEIKKSENLESFLEEMVFTKAGPHKNGIIHPAQLEGYDLNKINIKGKKTRSLKGLKLSDGSTVSEDVLVVELPHPTYLSNIVMERGKQAASDIVAEDLKVLSSYVDAGWEIEADEGMDNQFASGKPYNYGRKEIGTEYYDFGTPGARMVAVSDASRMPRNNHVIVFGTRERPNFDMTKINAMTNAKPAEAFSDEELFIARPRTPELRYLFDAGPGEKFARIMKENLDLDKIFTTKSGLVCSEAVTSTSSSKRKACEAVFASEGIDALVVKSSPNNGDFGHYRGTFNKPKVVILADPHGYDDMITSRALTGTRGQHLQRLMSDVGVNDQYLIIKTVPFGMDGASKADWQEALKRTSEYRSKLLSEVLKSKPSMILADGENAQAEAEKLLAGTDVAIVKLNRSGNDSTDMKAIAKDVTSVFKGKKISGLSSNIPRSHLSFYARVWEGTSGDRVLASKDKFRGFAFAEVAPEWAWSQKSELKNNPSDNIDALLKKIEENKAKRPGERIPQYLQRRNSNGSLSLIEVLLKITTAA